LDSEQFYNENYEIKFENGEWLVDYFDSQFLCIQFVHVPGGFYERSEFAKRFGVILLPVVISILSGTAIGN